MRDAKEPRLETRGVAEGRDVEERLGQRFLDEILAVQHGAHHARAESVEFGAKVAKYLFEGLVRHESMQLTMECSHVVPGVSVPGAAAGISALPAAGRLSDAPRRRARACP